MNKAKPDRGGARPSTKPDRDAALKAALKANLQKRKAQTKRRADPGGDADDKQE